ncbi:MAG: polyprenyl synthetase family protein [Nitrospirae bacterium]|nr:polyprenyl synthetase family protein [Nitrospirota bacterium]
MAATQTNVWQRYAADLAAVEAQLTANLVSDVDLVGEVARYVLGSGGKRFRPMLLAASARMAGVGSAGVAHHDVALLGCVIEYIHTATLLHDDVVDDGDVRRGQDAARTVWGNAGSVLVGDYLYARALAVSVSLGNLGVVRVLTHAVERMSEGEVFQLAVCGDMRIVEDDYIKIVDMKTAALMRTACLVGGMLGGLDGARLEALGTYGRNVGIAFQVADDTLDYQADTQVFGKALGVDLKDGKITLPLLYALQRCDDAERTRLADIIALDDEPSEDDLRFTLDLMHRHRAIDDAHARAREYSAVAKQAITLAFPDGPDRQALLALADYVVDRDR